MSHLVLHLVGPRAGQGGGQEWGQWWDKKLEPSGLLISFTKHYDLATLGRSLAQRLAYLFPGPAAPSSIPSVPKVSLKEKMSMLLRLINA